MAKIICGESLPARLGAVKADQEHRVIRHADSLIVSWKVAELEARNLHSEQLEPAHFFLGLLKVADIDIDRLAENWQSSGRDSAEQVSLDIAALRSAFAAAGVDTTPLRRRLRTRLVAHGTDRHTRLRRSAEARALFQKAEAMASRTVRPTLLLIAILEGEDREIDSLLHDSGVDRKTLMEKAREFSEPARIENLASTLPAIKSRRNPLTQFGRDLTHLAAAGQLQPIIGRREEILRLAQILLQNRKNNVILTGDAGVGKTGIVEGLAQRIVKGNVPEEFRSVRIIEISMASIVAGTTFRGDLEARLQILIKEASANRHLVLFIDEIHLLVGAGRGSHGAMDAANILKPALGRGEIRVIGATTTAEYRRLIENDAALERRFQVIEVLESTPGEALEILSGLKERLENHHAVRIEAEALAAAVDLSIRFIPGRRLPDKAIDLIDQACAQARLKSLGSIPPIGELVVDKSDIATVVSRICGLRLSDLPAGANDQLLHMEEYLRKRVKGQDTALRAVADALRMAKSGLSNSSRPIAVFLLAGPTGTGKTELAKAVAEFFFGDPNRMIRLDMSEYMEPHSVARLIGSPPGYVGHDEGGQLTEKIRTTTATVVLLDEIEKAHRRVLDVFLQAFDEGALTDGRGRKCDFRGSIIFLTSNLGSEIPSAHAIGFGAGEETQSDTTRILAKVRQSLSPEFANRLSDIIVFQPLTNSVAREVVDKFVHELNARLAEKQVRIALEEDAYALILEQGFSREYGARQMERAIDALVARPLAREILSGAVRPGTTIFLSANGKEMGFRVQEAT